MPWSWSGACAAAHSLTQLQNYSFYKSPNYTTLIVSIYVQVMPVPQVFLQHDISFSLPLMRTKRDATGTCDVHRSECAHANMQAMSASKRFAAGPDRCADSDTPSCRTALRCATREPSALDGRLRAASGSHKLAERLPSDRSAGRCAYAGSLVAGESGCHDSGRITLAHLAVWCIGPAACGTAWHTAAE